MGLKGLLRGTLAVALLWTAAPRPAQAEGGAKFATVNSAKANVYQEPNEAAPVVKKVKRGTFLEVGGVKGMWVKVRTDGGVVGFILKSDVVPGKKDLGGGPPPVVDDPGNNGGSHGGGHHGGSSGGSEVENRKGLLVKAGLQFAGNAYKISASPGFSESIGMKTNYTGLNAELDYFFIPAFGVHFRFMDAAGSQSATLSAPIAKKVDRIPTNIDKIELDGVGRFFLGSSETAPAVLVKLGFHQHEMRIDTVEKGGVPVYLVSNSYKGLVLGLGGDFPLGSPSLGLHAGLSYWLAPSLSEGKSGASGKAKGASGLEFGAGTYFNFNDTTGMDIGLEYGTFAGKFSGNGSRFNTAISGAKTADTYVLFGVNGTFRF